MEESVPTLDVVSDPICPWCYIGKTKLDRALAARPDVAIDIKWRIYQLNPDMPPEGMDRQAYLIRKFGEENAADVYGSIESAAEEAGLNVDFSKIKRTPNTVDAHRLIRWSDSGGRQHEIMGALFEAYFLLGEDIGEQSVLIEIGSRFGMDRDLLSKLFAEDTDKALLMNEDALSRQMGITGVPCFILQEKYALVGAQEVDTWLNVFDRLNESFEDSQ